MPETNLDETVGLLAHFLLAKRHKIMQLILTSINSLVLVMVTIGAWSIGIFLGSLLVSALTHTQEFLYFIAIPYIIIIAIILRGRHAMKAAGLLIGWDLLRDTLEENRGLHIVTPSDGTPYVELNYPRVEKLKALAYAARIVFYLVLIELISLALFGFIPIWEHPHFIGPLFLFGVIWILMETPLAVNSPFEYFKPIARAIWISLVGFLLLEQIFNYGLAGVNWGIQESTKINQVHGIPWIVILVTFGLIYVLSQLTEPEKKSEAKKK